MSRRRVFVDDLVDHGEAARRLGINTSALSNWRRRYADSATPFPTPVLDANQVVIYLWSELERWVERKWPDRLDD